MKKLLLVACIVGLSMTANSETLKFKTALGKELFLPIKQEKEMPLPPFIQIGNQKTYRIFDVTELSKPEVEDELPDFVKELKTANIQQ